ncbi:hypothetical protein ACQZ61_06535 [Agrobacterium vitis]|uniref:hypothetical protein n=1 Tax=Agrobacterium vitis TaxID=373 RepID=UPI000872D672|nr:hypothetical protein [Agrobacterium vitis]MCF1454100.1 hypothetical protein [Agrobacterium vitis]NSY13034.1 hypothetical protein [Agrobacterium vitis]NSY22791.1 hypothetical protein [Agrobacterium vitis]NTA22496.1 hypothetical protein [Agrobacterium vitis]WEO70761.1 hypothetical protein G6L01_012275 [Agrobacterium vitis]
MKKQKADYPADFPEKTKQPDATVRVGPHVIPVSRATFEAWEAKLTAQVGFSRAAIAEELCRRLGL